ncbi:hypothetical protein [Ferrovibrio sp.]|uniref:hypothetical protein n=1 Tax=Ferrovibrio sp. TaxID=1917215 RepID=UPI001B50108A|nr:hypothetical protein [Ferrovibrio sp.]MBP7065677.1 hypothetical protein [Ferrovibrio sp.]
MSLFGIGSLSTALPGLIQSVGSIARSLGSEKSSAANTTAVPENSKQATENEFLDFAKMSVGERIRAQYLKSKGMDEDQLGSLDSEARAKIEEEIREQIRNAIKQNGGKDAGSIANIVV